VAADGGEEVEVSPYGQDEIHAIVSNALSQAIGSERSRITDEVNTAIGLGTGYGAHGPAKLPRYKEKYYKGKSDAFNEVLDIINPKESDSKEKADE
jgi:hypothetical protein